MINPKTFVIYSEMNPEIGFAVTVSEKDYAEAVHLVDIGFHAWTSIGGGEDGDPEIEAYFSDYPYDDNYWYSVGWSEPSADLLEKKGIEFEIEPCFQEDGEWLEHFDVDKVTEIYS